MARRRLGEANRNPAPGLPRFILLCHYCGSERIVSSLPVQWQCESCKSAYTLNAASYVPHDTYHPR